MAKGNPLSAFALVQEEYEKSGDPIRGLRPIFAPLLVTRRGEPYRPDLFAQEFSSTYGIQMSAFVASALAERLVEIGLIEERPERRSERDYVVAQFEWAPEIVREDEIDEVLALFSEWASAKLANIGKAEESSQLANAFLERVARPEFVSIFVDEDSEKKKGRLRRLLGLKSLSRDLPDDKSLDYLVSEFVLTCAERAPEVFLVIARIAQGALIADAVAGLAAPPNTAMPDPPLRVVLDGPLIMDLLDLNTPEQRAYASDLLEMINAAELRVAVFDHSLDEARLTIRSTVAAVRRGDAYGPLAQRLRTEPSHSTYATMVADSLESRCSDLGITVLRSAMYEEARFKRYFPEEREDRIRNAIGDLHQHVDARIRDARSVATVARLKQDRIYPASLLEAGTIFVTRNSVLVKRVNRVLAIGKAEAVPRFCIATDSQFAGFMWFTLKIDGSNLSQKRLIANCSSAIVPRADFVGRMTLTLERMNPALAAEFAALMTDRRASMYAMRATLGDQDAVNPETSIRSLMDMKEALVEPERKRAMLAEQQVAALKIEALQEASRGKDVVATLQEALAEKQQVFDAQLAQLAFDLEEKERKLEEQRRQSEDARLRKLEHLSESIRNRDLNVKRAGQVIIFVSWIVVVLITATSILLPDYQAWWFRIVLLIAYLLGLPFLSEPLRVASRAIAEYIYRDSALYIRGLQEALGPEDQQADANQANGADRGNKGDRGS